MSKRQVSPNRVRVLTVTRIRATDMDSNMNTSWNFVNTGGS